MSEKEKNAEIKITRRPFKKGERERHFELLAKNEIALRQAKAKQKKCQQSIDTILDDIEANGYAEEAQGELGVDDETESRASA